MSLTPGYILTDEYGDSIGLTLTEVAAIVGESGHAPRHDKTRVTGGPCAPLVMWWIGRPFHLRVQRGEGGEGIYPSADDIAEMRAVLAAQEAA